MSYPTLLFDSNTIPVPCVYIPGAPGHFVVMAGSSTTHTDGAGNESSPIALDIQQIADQPVVMAGDDGVTPSSIMQIANGIFNGQTVDQQRGNVDTMTLLSCTGVTTAQNSGALTNYNHQGCIVVLTTTNIGTGSITLSITGIEPISSYSWTILSGTAVTTNTTVVYKVDPRLTAVSNSVAKDLLPRTWQVNIAANNANPADYSVYGMLCL